MSKRYDSFIYSRQPVCLKKTGSASESVAMRTPFFTVTSLAVHVTIRTVASNYRIQSLVAILTFETFLVPFLWKCDNVIFRKNKKKKKMFKQITNASISPSLDDHCIETEKKKYFYTYFMSSELLRIYNQNYFIIILNQI